MDNTQTEKNKSKKYLSAIGILAIILLVLSVMFFKEHRENRRYVNEIKIEKVNLENELSSISDEYDQIKINNDSLNNQLETEKNKIDLLKANIKKFKINSYAEINRYKKELGTLRKVLKSYIVQIDSLNTINKALTAENNMVKEQISLAKNKNKKLEESSKNQASIISKASTLDAQLTVCIPINKRGKKQKKASKTTKLKVGFMLARNITAARGEKTVFVRITRPDDIVLSNPENLLFSFEDTKLAYSAKRDIEYEGEQLEVSIFWDNDGSLIPGTYNVELFSEGKKIGDTTFYLK